jgi:hypothetical protein
VKKPDDKGPPRRPYEPPRILWEQPFVALTLFSNQPCDPQQTPGCPG